VTLHPTDRELRILGAYLEAGTCVKAAADLHLSEQTVKNALYLLRLKMRVSSNQQLVYEFGPALRELSRSRAR